MKSIYRNESSKKAVLELYDKQVEELQISYKDLYVDTTFGKTHLIECGNCKGKPLLVFHGGNATTLLVPAAIKNALTYKSISMAFPMLMYWLTHKEKWFIRCILPMALTESNITDDILATARCSIDNGKIKSVMPQNESYRSLCKYSNPVLVMAAEKDCLFPAKNVLPQVKRAWQQSITYLLKDRGHINELTEEEKKMIVEFLEAESV